MWLPVDLIRWDSRHYVLTNRRAMRVEGVLRKSSIDSSLEQITDIGLDETTFGRLLGYANLTLYTASDTANEQYTQLLDGLQFKKAVLDAKEAIRNGSAARWRCPRASWSRAARTRPRCAPTARSWTSQESAAPATAAAAAAPAPAPEPVTEPDPEPAATPEPEAAERTRAGRRASPRGRA